MRLSTTSLCVAFCSAILLAPSGFSDDNDPTKANPSSNALLGGNGIGFGFGGSGLNTADALIDNSALGIPTSAIPGKRWHQGSSLIIALSDDGKKAFGYSERHPRWAEIELAELPSEIKAVPVVGTNLAAVQYGPYCYAYSGELGKWDTQKINEKEIAVPIVYDNGVRVHSETKGDFVFKNAWGKWFSAEEIKSGAVAEYLASPAYNENADVSKESVAAFRILHTDVNVVERIVKQLFAQGTRQANVSTDPLNNALFVRGDQATLATVEALVKSLDAQIDGTNPNTSDTRRSVASHEYRPGWIEQPSRSRLPVPATESVSELRSVYASLNERAKKLAEEMRDSETDSDVNRTLLRDIVAECFESRQVLQRAEMAELTKRLNSIRSSIELRDRISDLIIDRRVNDLLDESKATETQPSSEPETSARNATGTVRRSVSRTPSVTIHGAFDLSRLGRPVLLAGQGKFSMINRTENAMFSAPIGSNSLFRFASLPDRKKDVVFMRVSIPTAASWELRRRGVVDPVQFLANNRISVSMTQDDVDRVCDGQLVNKAIYIPHDLNSPDASVLETLDSSELESGASMTEEIERRGILVAAIQFANRHSKSRAESESDANDPFGGSKSSRGR